MTGTSGAGPSLSATTYEGRRTASSGPPAFWSDATQRWYLVRFGLDGSVEMADTAPLQNTYGQHPGFYPNQARFESQIPAC